MDETFDNYFRLDEFWPYQVVVLADQISRHTSSVVKSKAGLNTSQWRVLAAVADKPGRTAAEVTAVTPMDKTIVSRAVASLIQEGLIKKTHTEGDKRRMSLTVTSRGLNIYEDVAAHLNMTLSKTSRSDGAEDEFLELLKIYSAQMNKIHPASD